MSRKDRKTENDAIEFLGDIRTSMQRKDRCMLVMAAVCVAVCLGVTYLSNMRSEAAARNIYVLDEGSVLQANRADNGEQRDLEVMDHVERFHELFYNLAPNINIINQNIGRALELADRSAYDYFSDLKEEKYFSRLIDINATQEIVIDSVAVDILEYPYRVTTQASLYVLRESNISRYEIETTCEVTEATRTRTNPHGLMINNFYASKPKFIGTQKR